MRLALVVLVAGCLVPTGEGRPPRVWGDLTGEGVVDTADAGLVERHAVGLPVTVDTLPGDVDADARVTTRDALIIRSYAAWLDVSPFRVGQPMP